MRQGRAVGAAEENAREREDEDPFLNVPLQIFRPVDTQKESIQTNVRVVPGTQEVRPWNQVEGGHGLPAEAS